MKTLDPSAYFLNRKYAVFFASGFPDLKKIFLVQIEIFIAGFV